MKCMVVFGVYTISQYTLFIIRILESSIVPSRGIIYNFPSPLPSRPSITLHLLKFDFVLMFIFYQN